MFDSAIDSYHVGCACYPISFVICNKINITFKTRYSGDVYESRFNDTVFMFEFEVSRPFVFEMCFNHTALPATNTIPVMKKRQLNNSIHLPNNTTNRGEIIAT